MNTKVYILSRPYIYDTTREFSQRVTTRKRKMKKSKSDIAIINSPEMKELIDSSLHEMDVLYDEAVGTGLDAEQVKAKIQSMYLRNLKYADQPVAIAKKLLAEGLTRIELDKMRTKDEPDEQMVSKDFKQAVKLTADLCKLVKDMQPREVTHRVQADDDKMIFDINPDVYEDYD